METISVHYNDDYYAYQREICKFGGWANRIEFEKYINPDSDVLDFGCGEGYLLKGLNCKRKVGVEINPAAQIEARENKVEVYTNTDEVKNESIDVIISYHALEHTLHPLCELRLLHKKLRNGGTIIFFVPCESINLKYKPNDINHHLYSWSPLSIGNLFQEAGFKVVESKHYNYKWPPHSKRLARLVGRNLFNILCKIYGRIEIGRSWSQVRVRGVK